MKKFVLLTSLFLCLPFVSRADGLVFGEDINEKNIPLEMNIMQRSFDEVFADDYQSYFSDIEENFYGYFYTNVNVPFSLKDLIEACVKGIKSGGMDIKVNSACFDFARLYINNLVEYAGVNVTKKSGNTNLSEELTPAAYSIRVVDAETKEGLQRANIHNVNYPERGCVTDSLGNGNCEERVLEGGKVEVSYMGYESQIVTLNKGEAVVVSLNPGFYYGGEVVITAKMPEPKTITYRVQVVDGETNEGLEGANIANINYQGRGCATGGDGFANCSEADLKGGEVMVSYVGYRNQKTNLYPNRLNTVFLERVVYEVPGIDLVEDTM